MDVVNFISRKDMVRYMRREKEWVYNKSGLHRKIVITSDEVVKDKEMLIKFTVFKQVEIEGVVKDVEELSGQGKYNEDLHIVWVEKVNGEFLKQIRNKLSYVMDDSGVVVR